MKKKGERKKEKKDADWRRREKGGGRGTETCDKRRRCRLKKE
jgi:hypothetical protein